MMNKLLYVLFLCILMTSCNNKMDSKSHSNDMLVTQLQQQETQGDIKIISSRTEVRLGEAGFITIQGQPRERYTIKTSYNQNGRTISVTQWRVAGQDGQVTFNWVVDPKTTPGTYTAVISGDGRSISVNHIVLP